MKNNWVRSNNYIWSTIFDGEEENKAAKTFTQEEVNSFLANERKKQQDQTKKALDELEALKTKSKLTSEERQALETKLEDLWNQLLTKEELALKEKKKIEERYTADLENSKKEAGTWRNKFENSTILRSITDASVVNEAFNPEQVVAILRPNTRLVEELDSEGKPSGNYIPKIKFSDTDSKGNPVVLDLTVAESVKRLKELDGFQNLFKAKGGSGLGLGNVGAKSKDLATLAKDPVEYIKARRTGKI